MAYFPMMVELRDKKVLVIGGGEEGKKKIQVLKMFGCHVTLIAKRASEEAVSLTDVFLEKTFEAADMKDDFFIVVAATEDTALNRMIYELAKEKKIPVNIVDNTELCTFIFPAIIKDEDVVVSVSSGGKSPYVAQHVKSLIIENMPSDIGKINERMGEYRKIAKKTYERTEERKSFLKEKLKELLSR